MAAWLAPPRALPIVQDATRWYMAAIVAAMAYLAALVGIGLVALGDARGAWEGALDGTLTLQLPADASSARLEVVLAVLRQTPGVSVAQTLGPAETARLLEPWLGKSVPVDILPMPRLVDIRIDAAGGVDIERLQQRLQSIAPEARLEDHRLWLARLLSVSSRLEGMAAAVIAAAAAIAVLSAVVTVSAGLAQNRERIVLLHALGADDRDIALRFAIPAAGAGLLGGAVGALAAAATWRVFAGAAGTLDVWFAPGLADPRVVALLAAAIVASGLIAAAAAMVVAWRRLGRLL
jgi:cell division transport system permease protein